MKRKSFAIASLLLLILVCTRCSTEKNTGASRFFHNTTSYYNIYFNGKESYKNGLHTIEKAPEDYTQILPVFKSDRLDLQSAVSGDMDIAIKKCVKLIKMHSITAKPKRKKTKSGKKGYKLSKEQKEFYEKNEYNKYVDDAYLLIGKAHFLKGEYVDALQAFHLIINRFRKQQVRYHAMYMIARTQTAMENYSEAENYLQHILSDKNHPEALDLKIELAYADLYVKQKKYQKAEERLEVVLPHIKKKYQKIRLNYIRAQLNQEINQNEKATALFQWIIKKNPPYDMAFNARIRLAKSLMENTENSESVRKILNKLLKDDKNVDFRDQIYYTLAGIDLKEKNTPQAIENYKKSIRYSLSQSNQKAFAYLALADIYFEQKKYPEAGNYYDSAVSVLDEQHPDYDFISKKAFNLKDLTDNLKLIAHEDSLQKVARMDSASRNTFILQIIRELEEKEAAELNAGAQPYNRFSGNTYDNRNTIQNNSGKWYFYNPGALSIGRTDFVRMWGKRKLEDHWRRKNKKVLQNYEETATNASDTSGRITDRKKPEFYLQDLPLTDSLMEQSNQRIAAAYFNAGKVYENRMKDYPAALTAYKTLIKRFPQNELVVEALFNMYLIYYKKLNHKGEAEQMRQRILSNYPSSKYAKILADPNYLVTLRQNQALTDSIYSLAYQAYKDKKYPEVLAQVQKIKQTNKQNHLEEKFLYLEAMAKGHSGNTAEMEKLLNQFVRQYPADPLVPQAQATLELMKSGKYNPNYYTHTPDTSHYFAVATSDKALQTKLNHILTTFNARKFPDKNLNVKKTKLTENEQVFLVQIFPDYASAKSYAADFMSSEKLTPDEKTKAHFFVITPSNEEKMKQLPILSKYLQFFRTLPEP